MTQFTRVVLALVRGWTSLYTLGVSKQDRERRRQEIESDLWESLHDSDTRGVPATLLSRLLMGIPDDIGWRVEQPRPARPLLFAFVFAGVCTLMLIGLITWAGTAAALPRPEPIVHFQPERRPPPPPPPPPAVPSRTGR